MEFSYLGLFLFVWFLCGTFASWFFLYQDKEFNEYLNYKYPIVARSYYLDKDATGLALLFFFLGLGSMIGSMIAYLTVDSRFPGYRETLKRGRASTKGA